MIAAATPSRAGPFALWVARVLVAIPFFIAALGLELSAGSLGDMAVKALVLALTLFILWVRLSAHRAETATP